MTDNLDTSDFLANRKPPISIPPALAPLLRPRRWVVWRLEPGKNGKLTKVPYQGAASNIPASTNNPSTWCDYETANRAYCAGRFDGIGFVLTGSGYAAFDIDDCIDPNTGEIHPWAADKIERCRSYAEVTPSKTGLRIIGLTNGHDGDELDRRFKVPDTNGIGCELYRKATRYIAVTGQQIGECSELANIDVLVDETFTELGGVERERDRVGVGTGSNGDLQVDPATIRMVLRFVKDADDGEEVRKKRIAIGRAIYRATDGEGYEIWTEWLASLGHWNKRKAEREWYNNFARGMNAERRVTFGTIMYWADRDTPGWRDELDWDPRDRKFLNLSHVEDPVEPTQSFKAARLDAFDLGLMRSMTAREKRSTALNGRLLERIVRARSSQAIAKTFTSNSELPRQKNRRLVRTPSRIRRQDCGAKCRIASRLAARTMCPTLR